MTYINIVTFSILTILYFIIGENLIGLGFLCATMGWLATLISNKDIKQKNKYIKLLEKEIEYLRLKKMPNKFD